jgi:hypothetical protein
MHAAFLATALTGWLNLLLGGDARTGLIRWRRELRHTPGRLVRHAGRTMLRCPPGALLPAVLARIRALRGLLTTAAQTADPRTRRPHPPRWAIGMPARSSTPDRPTQQGHLAAVTDYSWNRV